MALNRSPEFCLKLTYRYLLKAGHVPVDTRGSLKSCYIRNIKALGLMVSDKKIFPCFSLCI